MEELQTLNSFLRVLGGLENGLGYLATVDRVTAINDAVTARARKLLDDLLALKAVSDDPKIGVMIEDLRSSLALDNDMAELRRWVKLDVEGNYTAARDVRNALIGKESPDLAALLQGVNLIRALRVGQNEDASSALQALTQTTALGRAVHETGEVALRWLRVGSVPVGEFLAAHDRAWPVLEQNSLAQSDNVTDWAVAFWPASTGRLLYALTPGDPQAPRLRELLGRDLATLHRHALRDYTPNPTVGANVNPEWSPWRWLAEQDLLLDLAEQARQTGDLPASQAYLKRCELQARPALASAARKLQPLKRLMEAHNVKLDLEHSAYTRLEGRLAEADGRLQQSRARHATTASRSAMLRALRRYEAAHSHLQLARLRVDYAWALGSAGRAQAELARQEARRVGDSNAELRAWLVGALLLPPSGAEPQLQEALAAARNRVAEVPGAKAALLDLITAASERLALLQTRAGQGQSAWGVLDGLQKTAVFQPVPTRHPDLEKLQAVRGQLRSLESEGQSLRSLPEAQGETRGALQRNATLLTSKRGEFYTLVNQIRQQHPEFEQALAIRPSNFSELQRSIPEDAVVVQFFPSDQTLFFFVATRDSLKIRSLPLSHQQLDLDVAAARQAINSGLAPHPSTAELDALCVRLGDQLWKPVADDLEGKKVVAFVPSGSLFYLPLSALARRGADGKLEYLTRTKQVALLARSADLERLGRPPASRQGVVVAVGNPDGSLPGTAVEVQAIGQLFPQARVLTAEQATKSAFLQQAAASDLGVLHLATHGVLNPRDPSGSYLVLHGEADSARLTAAEVAELQLGGSTRLVTLSACQTALGEARPGSEVMSLADAFRWAGSPALLASLWKVSDQATELLMKEFYRRLRDGESAAAALQGAQQLLLDDPRYAHPFFWSSFALVGDWR